MKKKTKKKMIRKPLKKPAKKTTKKTTVSLPNEFSKEHRILLSVLAQTDSVWLPCRKPMDFLWENTYAARRRFESSGLPWNSDKAGGGTGVERMELSRLVSDMVAAGWLITNRDKQSRSTAIKLTESGDDTARRLADVPEFSTALKALTRLYECHPHPMCIDKIASHKGVDFDAVWVDERILLGGVWTPGENFQKRKWELYWNESMFLPLLWRGLALSLCNLHGAAHFALTPTGLALAGKLANTKHPVVPEPPYNKVAAQFYGARLKAECFALAAPLSSGNRERDIGELMLPCTPDKARPGRSEAINKMFPKN